MIEGYFDGACEPTNPGGWGLFGYVVRKDGKLFALRSGCIGTGHWMTNNVAEYYALMRLLKFIRDSFPEEKILIMGDSSLVINQIKGEFKVKNVRLKELWRKCRELMKDMNVKFRWIPREENRIPDLLCRDAYRRLQKKLQEVKDDRD